MGATNAVQNSRRAGQGVPRAIDRAPQDRGGERTTTLPGMEVRCWSDYLCPWCYVGSSRDALFTEAGFTVVHLPYELHPDIGPEGRRVRPDGRLRPTFDRVEEACAEAGLAFRRPTRMPNTRRALLTAEAVRRREPTAFAAVHHGLFAAHFAMGEPIDDPDVCDAIVTRAGGDAGSIRSAVESGAVDHHLDESMRAAREAGVSSTPTWIVGDLVIPGALDEATLRRWLGRLATRHRAG